MSKNFSEIINDFGSDVLTEDVKKSIQEAFETAVNEKTESRVKLEVEAAIQKIDEDHSSKLENLLEAIDVDHTNKLKKVLAKVDSDYATKLSAVIEKYEGMLHGEAVKFREQLVSEMSNFLDLYLDEMLPKEQLQEAVDNTKAKKLLNSIKEIVAVDDDFITQNIKEALEDGKDHIDSLRQELHEAMKANISLNQQLKTVTSDKMLIEKTINLDEAKKQFVMRVLKEKSPEEIEANFDYVIEMFERENDSHTKILKEEATKEVKSVVVDTPKAEEKIDIIEEQVAESTVDSYLAELKNI